MTAGNKRQGLRAPFKQGEVDQWWETIEGRLAVPAGVRSRRPVVAVGAAVTLVAAAAAAMVVWSGRSEVAVAPRLVASVEMTRGLSVTGESAPLAEFPGTVAAGVELSDHSRIMPEGPVEMRLLENSATRFEVKQGQGRVRYEVTPNGPRRWTVDCLLATVEVVGTAFSVESDPRRLRVQVERGVVLVRGERVPERVQRLTAGDEIVVLAAEEPAPRASASAAVSPPPVVPRASASRMEPQGMEPPRVWRELAGKGAFKDAYSELGAGGVARASSEASVSDLFALADVARFSGHPQEAVGPLSQVVQRGGAQAALAAFTLGRVRMDQLGDPAAAALDFERAVALGVGGGLREDAQVRRVEALARAGQGERAAEAARALVEQSPSAKKRVEKWLPR